MAILRDFRDAAMLRVYRRAAIVYLILALIVLVLTSGLPLQATEAGQAVPRWQSAAASLFFIIVAYLIVRRGFQVLTFLLSLVCLAQGISHLISAAGMRLTPGLQAALPANRLDWPSWQEFLQTELASETPFYHRELITSTVPVDMLAGLRSWPLIGRAVPEAGLMATPATVLVVCAALMGLATLALWRAARLRPR